MLDLILFALFLSDAQEWANTTVIQLAASTELGET